MRFATQTTLAVALAVCSLASSANAQEPITYSNFYSNGANQATAQMYISPVPVPAWVGHTYMTYQPLYPHHYIYSHTSRFHNYYDNGRGLNRTKVHYSTAPIQTMFGNLRGGFLPRR